MIYILDTNAVSALMKGDKQFSARMKQAGKHSIRLPQPVLAEIAYGIARLPRSRRKTMLREQFNLVAMELPRTEWTDEVSEAFGSVKARLEKEGQRLEDFDIAIAAHALAAGAILVTANLDQMLRVPGLHVEDWLEK